MKKYLDGQPLKIDEILNERSRIRAVTSRVRHDVALMDLPMTTAWQPTPKRSSVDAKKVGRIAKRLASHSKASHATPAPKAEPLIFDMWGETSAEPATGASPTNFIPEVVTKPVKKPETFGMSVDAPAVVPVHPGASYRPRAKDYADLVEQIATAKEAKARLDQLTLPRLLVENKHRLVLDATDLPEDQGNDDDEGNTGVEMTPAATAMAAYKEELRLAARPKTRNERRELALERVKKRVEDIKARRQASLGTETPVERVAAEVNQRAELVEARLRTKRERNRLRRLAPLPRMRGFDVPQAQPVVRPRRELADPARRLRPQVNLLKDRYLSYLQRNVVEPRRRVSRRRPKLKMFETFSHRHFE
ncbi:hypothetical protein H4R34_000371 [Dimargaris verticillata]|uniref:Ribosome biogenesis protein NOP53 n=1 Tax=Dimargaris verticillata TaxID=2761393 RepID=A0A9W8EBY5_9FUNG|nr:hypothetical protein H4R34_000371 [Dimargaris verticillata]